MTITDNGRVEVDEETLSRGRELVVAGRMPSKRELQKHLSKGWPIVNEVLTRLGDEARQETEKRRQVARQTMRRLSARKRSGSTRPVLTDRQRIVNEIPVSVAPAPVAELSEPVVPEGVGEHLVVTPVAMNETPKRRPRSWPVVLLTLPAFVAIWGGWVDLGRLTGFGVVHPFPGIPGLDEVAVNLAITLPIGLETYAAYALSVWMSHAVPPAAKSFARWSAVGSLLLGFAGQAAYHLMIAFGVAVAPWWITLIVSGVPVAVLGMGAALRHLAHAEEVNS